MKISPTVVTKEINVTNMIVMKKWDVLQPLLIVMIMISVLTIAANHPPDVYTMNTIVMTKTPVLQKLVQIENVIMSELIVMIMMLAQMTLV
jgi:hypothetical protein